MEIIGWLCSEAASGSPLVAYFSKFLKIVVEHSRMANQTHLFLCGGRVGSDYGATPRAYDFVNSARLFSDSMILFRQHVLLYRPVQTNLVPVIPALT